jgi:hypothetical protein
MSTTEKPMSGDFDATDGRRGVDAVHSIHKETSLMTFIRNRRLVATIVVASCLALPASAAADALPSTFRTDAAQSEGTAKATDDVRYSAGDDIWSHPGMPGFPKYDPPTRIEVVRPERTIVRDVDPALPLILSSTALLLVVTGFGFTLVRARMVPRPGRSH